MILALDCSTRSTGWALFDGKNLVDYGCIVSQKSSLFENIFTMMRELDKILKQHPIEQVIMEEVLPTNDAYDDGGIHHAKPTVFKSLMWLQAGINFLIYIKYNKIQVSFILPNSWRAKVGIKTGRGIKRETLKDLDRQFARDTFGVSVNDDIADALGIGWSQISPRKDPTVYDWS